MVKDSEKNANFWLKPKLTLNGFLTDFHRFLPFSDGNLGFPSIFRIF